MVMVVFDRDEQRELIKDRRARGIDRFDEVWDGIYIMSPIADNEHQFVAGNLYAALREALTLVDAACRGALDKIGTVSADDPDAVAATQAKSTVEGLAETAQRLLLEYEYDVAWTTLDDRSGRRTIAVAPLMSGNFSPARNR